MKARLVITLAAAVILSCAGCTDTERIISSEGVGSLTFGMETPELKGYKAAFKNEYDDWHGEYDPRWDFSKDGKVAVKYYKDWCRIEVLSPEFRTEAGLRVGMTIAEAQTALGVTDFKIEHYTDASGFTFIVGNGIEFRVPVEGMVGGRQAFDNWIGGSKSDLSTADFEPATVIETIVVRQY